MKTKRTKINSKNKIYGSVIDTIRRIGNEEPVIFQRDGGLVVASSAGFGIVNYGVSVDFSGWRKGQKDEKKYFQPLIRNCDDRGPTIEEMAKAVKTYSKLSNDDNVRMVNHSSYYRSHKYGYGVDGVDVAPQTKKTIPLKKYLELMDETEEAIFKDTETQFGKLRERSEKIPIAFDIYGNYLNKRIVSLPDAFVLTPNLFISFLRRGTINTREEEINHWDRNTELCTDHYVDFEEISGYKESPFDMNVTINSRNIRTIDTKSFKEEQKRIVKEIDRELSEVRTTVELMEPVLTRLNGLHNELFSENIKDRKELRMSA